MKRNEAEKKAEQIAKIISDVTLDLDEVGVSIARMKPVVIFNRLMNIAEAAEWEMEEQLDKERR